MILCPTLHQAINKTNQLATSFIRKLLILTFVSDILTRFTHIYIYIYIHLFCARSWDMNDMIEVPVSWRKNTTLGSYYTPSTDRNV
jgi:hypothetical protein